MWFVLYLFYFELLSPQVKNPSSPESARVLALLCLGEVGRNGSLGGSKEVQRVILEAFSSTSEEVMFGTQHYALIHFTAVYI